MLRKSTCSWSNFLEATLQSRSEKTVATIILQLDPARLSNPDLDIRYVLPDLLIANSSGGLSDDGYDYGGDGPAPHLFIFLRTDEPHAAVGVVVDFLKSERVLENDLSEVLVAVEDGDHFRVVHPPGFSGMFHRPRRGIDE